MKNSIEVGTDTVQFQKDIDHLRKMLQHFEETNEQLITAVSREKENRKLLENQSLELKSYQNIINLQNRKINRTLSFFQNLQSCIQPSEQLLLSYFPDSCILQMSKDSIGGDVPWVYKKDHYTYIAILDSSPEESLSSATLSVVSTLLLNTIVQSTPIMTPAQILDQLHHMFWVNLKQGILPHNAAVSVGIALVRINTKDKEIAFAGAHSDCMLLSASENNLTTMKGSKFPIGGLHYKNIRKPYANTFLSYHLGDSIYLASNGLFDQIGGTDLRKFSRKRFIGFAKAKRHLRMQKFASECLDYLDEWMLGCAQTDDILLLGIRF